MASLWHVSGTMWHVVAHHGMWWHVVERCGILMEWMPTSGMLNANINEMVVGIHISYALFDLIEISDGV